MVHAQTRVLALGEGRAVAGLSSLPGVAPCAPGRFAEPPPCVFANGGASPGDRDALMSELYPLPRRGEAAPSARLRFLGAAHDLRCRAGELYLGALTWRGGLQFFAALDARMYEAVLVSVWAEEVCGAALAYLGPGARL